jgi:hypothetical protein
MLISWLEQFGAGPTHGSGGALVGDCDDIDTLHHRAFAIV